MPLHPPGSNFTETVEHDLEQIVTLDRLGYKEAWIGEHFTAEWENIPAPDLFIAQALGLTENIVLGTGVTCMPNHNPFMLAHRIAQLDHMAKGRFYWGVGSGGFPGDFEVFGFDPDGGEHRRCRGMHSSWCFNCGTTRSLGCTRATFGSSLYRSQSRSSA